MYVSWNTWKVPMPTDLRTRRSAIGSGAAFMFTRRMPTFAPERGAERLRQRAPLFRKGEISGFSFFHAFPFRNAVVNDGS